MTNHDERLGYAFRFTQDDLRVNQKERVAENQVAILQAQQRLYGLLLIGACFALILIVVVSYVGMSINLENCFVAGVLILAVLIALTYVGKKFADYRNDIKQAVVKRMCGEITLDIIASRHGANYYLALEGRRFRLRSKEQLLALRHHETYCVYYAPHSRHILSVEAQ